MNEPVVALVVAAGSGSRLGGQVPKALVRIDGKPLVRWSVDALAAGGCERAVVVVAASLLPDFAEALAGVGIPVELVVGGARRQDSVANGLAAAGEHGIVLVHDAARPFVPADVVLAVRQAVADGHVCVIPVVPVVDTIRRRTCPGPLEAGDSEVVDRSALVAVQTPQGFDLATLREAHRQAAERGLEVTDDAAVCEALGHPVRLVPGSRDATKVTEPFDLLVAEAIAAGRRQEQT
ncbi:MULTISPECIES: 2-C-methyl-D-erythritol 4-phosphate cytidylyltransferase [unclassified Luteococcus]|uniref:2-C-methyl-D-erythritol 4-phosphate cytidylyltransferase n=1 Tax=unclassified Luteococcus TaxID=2639923 RepID=UPI00313CAF0C